MPPEATSKPGVEVPPVKAADRDGPQVFLEPLLLNIKMAAAVCSLSVRSVERLLSRGCFPQPVRPGGSRLRRWTRQSLIGWIDDGCGNGGA